VLPPKPTSYYVLGTILGGATVALVLLPVSLVLEHLALTMRLTVAIAISVYGLLADNVAMGFPRPGAHMQVPSDILTRGDAGSFLFGLAMGTGSLTYITTSAPWVVAGFAALAGTGFAALIAAGLAFGSARGAIHLAKWFSKDPLWQVGLGELGVRPTLLRAVSNLGVILTLLTASMRLVI